MAKKESKNNLVLYKAPNGDIELRGDFSNETVWATQAEIVKIFQVDQSVVSRHVRNIFKDGEVSEKSNMQKMHIANSDKPVTLYSLDVILAVGYRTNSKIAINFRKWATKTLREYMLKGFALNKKRIKQNHQAFLKSIADIQVLLPEHINLDPKAILELVKEFAGTWQSLDAYDKQTLKAIGTTKKAIQFSATELAAAIGKLQKELMKKGEATDLFATERSAGSLEGIVGNVMQSFGGKNVYATNEEKAANMLYFVIKNHPFIDGNKRSGAFAFVWFLRKARVKGYANINPSALTALTLLIAESDPKKKEQMVALVTTLLVGKVAKK